MRLPAELRCPRHRQPLEPKGAASPGAAPELRCAAGCAFPVRDGIPRFVESSGYAGAFGVQWNAFRRTQLDSHTGTTISRDRLSRCLGGSLDGVRGKDVLETGCGAGRFTEVLLGAGARVFACDLSSAVVANFVNCAASPDYFVCQADVLSLPFARASFDVVVALGMIQHTPSPERTIAALAEMPRPGGLLVIDHYAPLPNPGLRLLGAITPRHLLRQLFLRLPPQAALRAAAGVTRALLPLHRALWRPGRAARIARAVWRRLSPVHDYYDRLPGLSRALLEEWAFLDTHDALTDRYKHLRTPTQVAAALTAAGLEVEHCGRGGNGVEARARRPLGPATITSSPESVPFSSKAAS